MYYIKGTYIDLNSIILVEEDVNVLVNLNLYFYIIKIVFQNNYTIKLSYLKDEYKKYQEDFSNLINAINKCHENNKKKG